MFPACDFSARKTCRHQASCTTKTKIVNVSRLEVRKTSLLMIIYFQKRTLSKLAAQIADVCKGMRKPQKSARYSFLLSDSQPVVKRECHTGVALP